MFNMTILFYFIYPGTMEWKEKPKTEEEGLSNRVTRSLNCRVSVGLSEPQV